MKFQKSIKNSLLLQIVLYYLIGNLLFVLFLSSIFYYSSKYIIMNKEIEYTIENVQNTSSYITLYIDKMKNIINLLSVDADIEDFLTTGRDHPKAKIRKMIDLILKNNHGIKNITVIGKNGITVSNEENMDMNISSDMMKETWYVDAINNSDIPVFNPIRKNDPSMSSFLWMLSISRNIKNEKGEHLGVIVFDVKYEILERYLNSQSKGKQSDSLIINSKNSVIYYKDVSCFINRKCLNKFLSDDDSSKEKFITEIDIENTDWRLFSVANMDKLVTLKKSFSHIVIAIFLISLFFTSLVLFLVIDKLLKPLIKLESHMQQFERTLSEFSLDEEISYEIEVLIQHFNMMVGKIKYLREYEIKALHSQINPHFLYNTLDTIIWMAEFEDNAKVIAITKSLASFFRLSLSNGNERITLKDEIEHIREYLFIQKQRYEDKLTYFFNVDESLLQKEVPKIIIQPIVENSIYHGIKNIAGTGIININVYKEDDCIHITVSDNGIGFSESKKFHKSKTGGVGVSNVDKRIKFYYGDSYGVFIKETVEGDSGAEVTIKLPL